MSMRELIVRSKRPQSIEATPEPFGTAVLLVAAILFGAAFGHVSPDAGAVLSQGIDATLLAMISLLFFELRLSAVRRAFGSLGFLALAWSANFLIIPLVGFAIASLFLSGNPLLFTGLMIYFLAPCTDWFLGFTRMARGDTELGTALIPINLITQLLLFPVWLWLFTQHTGLVDFGAIPGILLQWFLLPLVIVQSVRFGLEKILMQERMDGLSVWIGPLISLVLAMLIFQIFAANVGLIAGSPEVFALVAGLVFLFFCATYFVGRGITRLGQLSYPQHALLAMTMGARNAPLMLVLTAIAIPDQPLILAVIVTGMLVEMPLLTGLRQIILWRHGVHDSALAVPRPDIPSTTE